jgi:NTE family protein
VRRLIIEENIQRAALLRLPFAPTKWRHRVEMLALILEKKWGITGKLQELPSYPFWEVNCTTFETGGRFRFRRDYMGDEKIGYVQRPNLPISHMIAASAAFPVLIGPYILKTAHMKFSKDKFGKLPLAQDEIADEYTLWDGGVYDNLGLDALHKIGRGLDREINFAIVSNAGAPIQEQLRGRPSQNLRRLLEIATSQTDSLRSRDFISSVVGKQKGLYLKIGHNPENEFARHYPTTLNAPHKKDFRRIFDNGYEAMRLQLKI